MPHTPGLKPPPPPPRPHRAQRAGVRSSVAPHTLTALKACLGNRQEPKSNSGARACPEPGTGVLPPGCSPYLAAISKSLTTRLPPFSASVDETKHPAGTRAAEQVAPRPQGHAPQGRGPEVSGHRRMRTTCPGSS